MQQEEAAGVVSLANQVLSLIHLTETELIEKDFSDGWFEIGEGEVPHQAIRDDLSVMGLLLPVYFGKGLMDDFLVIVFDGSQFAQFAPLLIVTLLGVTFLSLQLEVTEGAEQPHFFSH